MISNNVIKQFVEIDIEDRIDVLSGVISIKLDNGQDSDDISSVKWLLDLLTDLNINYEELSEYIENGSYSESFKGEGKVIYMEKMNTLSHIDKLITYDNEVLDREDIIEDLTDILFYRMWRDNDYYFPLYLESVSYQNNKIDFKLKN